MRRGEAGHYLVADCVVAVVDVVVVENGDEEQKRRGIFNAGGTTGRGHGWIGSDGRGHFEARSGPRQSGAGPNLDEAPNRGTPGQTSCKEKCFREGALI